MKNKKEIVEDVAVWDDCKGFRLRTVDNSRTAVCWNSITKPKEPHHEKWHLGDLIDDWFLAREFSFLSYETIKLFVEYGIRPEPSRFLRPVVDLEEWGIPKTYSRHEFWVRGPDDDLLYLIRYKKQNNEVYKLKSLLAEQREEKKNYIIVFVPHKKYWDGEKFVDDIDSSEVFEKFGACASKIWEDKTLEASRKISTTGTMAAVRLDEYKYQLQQQSIK